VIARFRLSLPAILAALTIAIPAFTQTANGSKLDRGLKESMRRGAPTQSVIITFVWGTAADGDNIVWVTAALKGRFF
jgi:hypothetical protein